MFGSIVTALSLAIMFAGWLMLLRSRSSPCSASLLGRLREYVHRWHRSKRAAEKETLIGVFHSLSRALRAIAQSNYSFPLASLDAVGGLTRTQCPSQLA
jgi:hypothetical protein